MISVIFTAAILLADVVGATQPGQIQPAPQAVQTPAAEAPQKAPGPDDKVCHTTHMVGSRLPVKLCATARQEAMRKFEDRQLIEGAQRLIDPGH